MLYNLLTQILDDIIIASEGNVLLESLDIRIQSLRQAVCYDYNI